METPTPTLGQAREVFKRLHLKRKTSSVQSRYQNVTYLKNAARWTPTITVHQRKFTFGLFLHAEEEFAARIADKARWFLQDFLPRAPRYNFPDEYKDAAWIGPIPPRILNVRCLLISAGIPKNKPHHPDFVPEESKPDTSDSVTAPPLIRRTDDPKPFKAVSTPAPADPNDVQCCPNGVGGEMCDVCWVASGGKLPRS